LVMSVKTVGDEYSSGTHHRWLLSRTGGARQQPAVISNHQRFEPAVKIFLPLKNNHIIILHHFYNINNYSSRIQPRSSYIKIKWKSPYIKIETKSPYIETKRKSPYTKYITIFDKNDRYHLCITPRVCCVQLLASQCSPQAIRIVALEVLLARIRAIQKYATHSSVKMWDTIIWY
jgi:hypothetical protein